LKCLTGWVVKNGRRGTTDVDIAPATSWRRINVTFPERQIYIRSDGRVQFFTFDPMMQAILAGAGLLFLGWVAFTVISRSMSNDLSKCTPTPGQMNAVRAGS